MQKKIKTIKLKKLKNEILTLSQKDEIYFENLELGNEHNEALIGGQPVLQDFKLWGNHFAIINKDSSQSFLRGFIKKKN